MPNITVVFIEPESEENIGALARVMANFGLNNLIIINPKVNVYSEKVKIVAREKGWEIIKKCKIYDDLDQVISLFDITYGTTGIAAKKGNETLRNPLTPEEFAKEIIKYKGNVGIFFGRESIGFTNEELNRFDAQITIPASEEYPVLNITHAAAIIFYEIFKAWKNPIRKTFKLINNYERFTLIKLMKKMVDALPTQEYRKPVIKRVLRNIIGKAIITKREYTVLAGVFRIVYENLKNK